MPTYGMTEQGFVPKRLADINNDIIQHIAGITDAKTGTQPFMSVADDSILGQLTGIFANALSECWEAAYEASVQFNPLYNTGAGQSGTVQLNGIVRKAGGYTKIICTLTGDNGVKIPKGALIGDMSGEYSYALDNDVTLKQGDNENIGFTCTTKATNDPAVGTVQTIQTAVSGWYSVINTSTVSVGQPAETDAALRKRQQQSTSLTSYRHIEAIYAGVLAVEDVTYCRVYQNATNPEPDDKGISYKEIKVLVEGGEDQAIAEAMFLRMPVAVLGEGTTTVNLTDLQGLEYPIKFTRPKKVPIYITMSLQVVDKSVFPGNYADLIKQYIIDYAVYDNYAKTGFPPGAPVVRSRIYTPVNKVPGMSVTDLKIGKVLESVALDDIELAWDEVAEFKPENMTISFAG